MKAAEVLRAVPVQAWYALAIAGGVWWAWRSIKGPVSGVLESVGQAVDAVVDGVGEAAGNIAAQVNAPSVTNQTLSRFGLKPKGNYRKKGAVWYGYDDNKAKREAQAAANSQIAKDIKQYGGGYGALTK